VNLQLLLLQTRQLSQELGTPTPSDVVSVIIYVSRYDLGALLFWGLLNLSMSFTV